MNNILLIGCGHMGSSLLNSWYKIKTNNFTIVDPKNYKLIKKKYRNYKIDSYKSINNINNISKFNIVIFAIKPQISQLILREFKMLKFKKNTLFISIVAGKKISFFKKNLKNSNQIIRVMPNMPSIVEEGMTCLTAGRLVSKNNKKKASDLFSKVGEIIWLTNENKLDMATALSGSGPGYFFYILLAMQNAGIKLGFSKKISSKLVYQTFYGSLKYYKKINKSPQELIRYISVKGGTTEAGLRSMKKYNLEKIFSKSLIAAYKKATFLGKKNNE